MSVKNSVKISVTAIILSFGLAVVANADTDKGLFSVRGIGAQKCTVITEAMTGDNAPNVRRRLGIWIDGYVTHKNRSEKGIFESSPIHNSLATAILVTEVCKKNPDILVDGVVNSVLRALGPLAATKQSELVTLKTEAGAVTITVGALTKVQIFLVEKGLLEAKQADGKFGPKTGAAIQAWQEQNNIPQSGLPEAFTLLSIAKAMK